MLISVDEMTGILGRELAALALAERSAAESLPLPDAVPLAEAEAVPLAVLVRQSGPIPRQEWGRLFRACVRRYWGLGYCSTERYRSERDDWIQALWAWGLEGGVGVDGVLGGVTVRTVFSRIDWLSRQVGWKGGNWRRDPVRVGQSGRVLPDCWGSTVVGQYLAARAVKVGSDPVTPRLARRLVGLKRGWKEAALRSVELARLKADGLSWVEALTELGVHLLDLVPLHLHRDGLGLRRWVRTQERRWAA